MNALMLNSRKYLYLLVILLSFTILPNKAQTDREFWYVMPNITPNHNQADGQPNYLVFTTTDLPATVRIEMPAQPAWNDVVLEIPAHSNYRYELDEVTEYEIMRNYWDFAVGTPWINGKNIRGIHITSTSLITVYHEYSNPHNPDIFALKGKNALGREFYTTFQTTMYNVNNSLTTQTGPWTWVTDFDGWDYPAYSAFDIVFTDNNTMLTLEIPAGLHIYDGPGSYLDGTDTLGPFQQGETFSAIPYQWTNPDVDPAYPAWKASDYYQDGFGRAGPDHLTGVKVTATKDIAITLKDDSMKSRHKGCYDLGGDQTIPTRLTGKVYIAMRGQLEQGTTVSDWYAPPTSTEIMEELYVTAIHDNTDVNIDGTYMATIDAGQYYRYDIPSTDNIVLVEASDSVYVLQMSGWGCEIGEAILPTVEACTGSAQIGFTRADANECYLNIMVRDGAEDNFLLNGAYDPMLDVSNFTQINADWWAARIGPVPESLVPTGLPTLISNTEDVFHLGIINGTKDGGTRFGYFSDYNVMNIESFIVGSGSRDIRLCYGESAQIVAFGGFFYEWTPSDSLSDPTSPTPIANPSKDITYTAHATGACKCKDSTMVTVSVATFCQASFEVVDSSAIYCSPDSVQIRESCLGVKECKWFWRLPDHPEDATSYTVQYDSAYRDSTFYHTYTNTSDTVQNWQIMLVTRNPYDCRDTAYGYVSILPDIDAEFTINDSIGCQPLTVTFNNQSFQANRFQWKFGDNTGNYDTTGNPITHSYLNYTGSTRTFTPRLYASKFYEGYGICRDSAKFDDIIVYPQPEVDLTIDPYEACSPYTATFEPMLETVDTVRWTFDNPSSIIVTNNLGSRNYTYSSPSVPIYPTVILEGWSQYGGEMCKASDTVNLTIYPEVHAIFEMDTSTVCDNDSIPIHFTNTSTGVNLEYMWQFGNSGSSNLKDPPDRMFENKDSITKIYNITLEAESQSWLYCRDDTTIPLSVYPYIKANFDISDALLTCHAFDTRFTNLTNRANWFDWSSSFAHPNDGLLNRTTDEDTAFSVTYINTNIDIVTDTVTLIARNPEGCIDMVKNTLQIYPVVLAGLSALDDSVGCHPLTIEFKNECYPDPPYIKSYTWNYGDSTTYTTNANTNPPPHTFMNTTNNVATYPVTITARNNYDCEHTATKLIKVAPKPTASFSFNDSNKCHPRMLYLEDGSYGSIATPGRTWIFDDGTANVTNNGSVWHQFTNPAPATQNDTFNVQLAVRNMHLLYPPSISVECRDTFTRQVVVYPEIKANFTPSPNIGCNPLSVNFTNESTPGSTYFYWDFADNTYDSIKIPPTHIFENEYPTDYNFPVHLTALSENLICSHDTAINVTVYGFLDAAIKIDDPSICHGESMHIYNQSIGDADTSLFDFGNGLELPYSQSDFYRRFYNTGDEPDTLYINLHIQNSHRLCDDYATHKVVIYPEVRAAFDSILPGCHPLQRTITNKTEPGIGEYIYEWEFGDGGTSISTNPYHQFNNPGYSDVTYTVRMKATSEYECYDSAEHVAEVYHVPLAKMFVPANIACTPFPVTYSNHSRSADATYYWDFNSDGNVDTITYTVDQDVVYAFANTGTSISNFTSRLYAESTHGCNDFDTLNIQVYPGVTASFTPDTVGCSPFIYHPLNNSANADNYDWTFISGNTVYRSTVEEPMQTLPNKTNASIVYTVILDATSESGCAGADTHYVTVHPMPRTGFSVSSHYNTWEPGISLDFYNKSEHVTRFGNNHPIVYTWDFGDNTGIETNGDTTVPHSYTTFSRENDRSYVVVLTGTNNEFPQCVSVTIDTIFMDPPAPELYVLTEDSIVEACQPATFVFNVWGANYVDPYAENPVTWNWDDDSIEVNNQYTNEHTYDKARQYRVQVTLQGYGQNNTTTYSINIRVYPNPEANFEVQPQTVSLPDHGQINLYNYSSGATSYNWYLNEISDDSWILSGKEPLFDYQTIENALPEGETIIGDTINISLIAYTDFGCTDTFTDGLGIAIVGKGLLHYPLAFQPSNINPDNQVFKPFLGDEEGGILEYEIWIYDRWGELMYHSTDPSEGWNGKFKNKECRMDAYVYKVKALFSSGKSYFHVGDVTLIR